jgi:hypothetical protein
MAIDVRTHPVGPERNLFTRSDGLAFRVATSVVPSWVPRDLGFTVRVDWPDAPGAPASHAFIGSLRSTPRSAERARRRLEDYWSRGPARPARTMIVYMSAELYKAHWKRHPCSADDCPGQVS